MHQSSQARGHVPLRQERKHPADGDAYKPVLSECVPGAFHFDIIVGRKLLADPKRFRGTSLGILADRSFKSAFQIPADWAIHTHSFGVLPDQP
jgi:hypothetical protein